MTLWHQKFRLAFDRRHGNDPQGDHTHDHNGAYLANVHSVHNTANDTVSNSSYENVTAQITDIEVGSTGIVIVQFAARFRPRGTADEGLVTVRVNGPAGDTGSLDDRALRHPHSETLERFGTTETFTGLAEGTYTATMRARAVNPGSVQVLDQSLTVITY